MKQKIQPGGLLDFLSPEEFLEASRDQTSALLKALGKNMLFKRPIVSVKADSTGKFSVTAGPNAGFIWDLRWVQWSGGGIAGASMNMYIGDPSTLNTIGTEFVAGSNVQTYPSNSFLFYAPDYLTFTNGNVASTANQPINIQMGIVEVPFGHESQVM